MNLEKARISLEKTEKEREELIQLSRELTKKSKSAIYHIHRDEIKNAEQLLKTIKMKPHPLLAPAMEEYGEARLFLHFVKTQSLLPFEKLSIPAESYFCALADLTGELERRAVLLGIKKKTKDVEAIRNFIDEVMGEFMKIDLKNGDVRRKFDAIKWNLKKVEQILFELM
ncbi:hypothetical protein C4573_04250 [Candidatus Woesearchaeota archaeon]|nr:MAG: hypothetical protein C4573_04250 [Candidatus Woesearchaeota archaeon]